MSETIQVGDRVTFQSPNSWECGIVESADNGIAWVRTSAKSRWMVGTTKLLRITDAAHDAAAAARSEWRMIADDFEEMMRYGDYGGNE